MKAIRVNEHGGPEVLSYEDVPDPEPGPGEARVKLAAAGINFIDVYQRTGLYPIETPFTLGLEGAGEVDAVGEGVEEFAPGDYVAFASVLGAYAEYVVAPVERLVPFNVTLVEARVAAAAMLQGMTAHYLTHSTYPLEEGETTLVHAAAGGVGVHAVYDSVGKSTFDGSLDCLRPRGYMVLLGDCSGHVTQLDLQVLNQ